MVANTGLTTRKPSHLPSLEELGHRICRRWARTAELGMCPNDLAMAEICRIKAGLEPPQYDDAAVAVLSADGELSFDDIVRVFRLDGAADLMKVAADSWHRRFIVLASSARTAHTRAKALTGAIMTRMQSAVVADADADADAGAGGAADGTGRTGGAADGDGTGGTRAAGGAAYSHKAVMTAVRATSAMNRLGAIVTDLKMGLGRTVMEAGPVPVATVLAEARQICEVVSQMLGQQDARLDEALFSVATALEIAHETALLFETPASERREPRFDRSRIALVVGTECVRRMPEHRPWLLPLCRALGYPELADAASHL
jgi:hypothetical protein